MQSLSNSQIPSDWLTANVTMVFEKGIRSDPSKYRPISLVVICYEIMDHVLCHYIVAHFKQHSILKKFQCGFRPGHSSQAQLSWRDTTSTRPLPPNQPIVMLDFSKAFDTVPHQKLMKKLQFYGIKGNILNWIKIWLTQRSQRVVINDDHSEFLHVESGVLQGTVLGPIIYINDIGEISSSIRLFANDCMCCIQNNQICWRSWYSLSWH